MSARNDFAALVVTFAAYRGGKVLNDGWGGIGFRMDVEWSVVWLAERPVTSSW